MPVDVLLGLQWGDEGKGKVVDFLAPSYDIIARFQGGPNAGHTLEFEGIKHVLHQIPSGIFHPSLINVIGNGVVLDPVIFIKEIEALAKYKVDLTKLLVSKKAQLILPTHRLLDAASELSKGDKKIGSTLKGIGPCYQDKIARTGLRVGDVLSPDFRIKYDELVEKHLSLLEYYGEVPTFSEEEERFFGAMEYLRDFNLIDSEYYLNEALQQGKNILAEGAQGSMLDIDFGSYPYVTSSSTMVSGACSGLGIAPSHVREVLGITKAYCTRVGSGPFPTELDDADGEKLRKNGKEFGSTTGRSRRTGWLDLPALNYAIMINGVSKLYMMKVDVMDDFDQVKVATSYELKDGTRTCQISFETEDLLSHPIYQDFDGWMSSSRDFTSFDSFPKPLAEYLRFIEQETGVPIEMVSTGPDRKQTIFRK